MFVLLFFFLIRLTSQNQNFSIYPDEKLDKRSVQSVLRALDYSIVKYSKLAEVISIIIIFSMNYNLMNFLLV